MSGRHQRPDSGRIDRSAPLHFTFNGRRYQGYAGDTLASALLANGVKLIGRSFKYHRPRGIVSAGSEEPTGLVQLEIGGYTEPNLRATQIELYEGLITTTQNAWPSVEYDFGAVNNLFSKIFIAGFYYKTFMQPRSFWMRYYEPAIRRMAGMGRASREPDPDIYDRMNEHCDVLVVGAGPAGLAAAQAAARTGARVMLADEQSEMGGNLLTENVKIDGRPGTDWLAHVVTELDSRDSVRLLPRTTVFGYYDYNYLCAVERCTDHLGPKGAPGHPRQRVWHIRAKQVVLATGAHERPLVFADNDKPGVMLAGSVRTYVNRFATLPGRNAVVFTNNDSAWSAAFDMADAGMAIAAIVDRRDTVRPALAERARERGIRILAGTVVTGVTGRRCVAGVEVARLASDGTGIAGGVEQIECDLVAMSGGWNPAVHLFCQSQGKLRYDDEKACFVPGRAAQKQYSAGSANGAFALADVLIEGFHAGISAVDAAGYGATANNVPPRADREETAPLRPLWLVPSTKTLGHGAKRFVDLQNDVTAADLLLAHREGLDSVEHVKRYTTSGMGTDQGKTSNVNTLAILAEAQIKTIPMLGVTTFRAPYTPVTYGALAGRDVGHLADPIRTTAIHRWHVEHGAAFEDVGQWKRPWFFPKPGEDMHQAVARETKAVRDGVGILDASTLGKIQIEGPDSAEFLNRIYTNAWKKLDVGRSRYGLMCREDGMVFDDGVTSRIGENSFLMTTTTGGAANVLDWLEEYLQTEWPTLKVYCTSVTEQWATISIAGPKSIDVMHEVAPGLDVSSERFPFMSFQEGTVAGVAARIFRISFTGEVSFEINVPSYYGLAVWEAVWAAGEKHGMTPYGTETMHVLRAEKGFIIVGQETDGTVTPIDLGMDWIVSKQKDFVGRRSLTRSESVRSDRKQLVGLLTEDPKEILPEGAQLVFDPSAPIPMPMCGHVTSSYWSPNCERSIALALVKGGLGKKGETVHAPLIGRTVRATIVDPVFFDPENKRRD
ncbi:MAG: sarcosine oxidase subunit alpha [Rhodospirillaceae bacterium]|nr:sarcosine oxidase subunit alpha [Rhodospirillaceae bacterium]